MKLSRTARTYGSRPTHHRWRRPQRRRPVGFRPHVEALEMRTLLTATITDFQLLNDSGESSQDRITSDASVSGMVQWTAPETTSVSVEFDHNGDGLPEGSDVVFSSGASVYYDPVAVDAALANWEGALTLQYRPVAHHSGGDDVGDWQSFQLTLDRVAPAVVSFSEDGGVALAASPNEITIVFREEVAASSVTSVNIFVENTSNPACYAHPVSQPAPDTATIQVGGSLSGATYRTTVLNVTDLAGNALAQAATADWRITAAPTTSGIPDVQSMSNAEDTTIALDAHFSDEFDASADLTYEIVSNSNQALFDATTISGSSLTLDYNASQAGAATIVIRATDSDGMYVEDDMLVETEIGNEPPRIVEFSAIEGITGWTFEGFVIDEHPLGMTITFGGLLEGVTTNVLDASGLFQFDRVMTEEGFVTATTTDDINQVSNLVSVEVVLIT